MTNYSSKERIISVGKLKSFEFFSENFVILDISGIYLDADEIGVCWNKNGHKWELVNDGAIIKENKLDATRYIFRNHLFEDEKGIPNIGYYIENQCGTVGTVEGVIYQNDSDIIIEYD
ncbi:hypothetical protein [Neptunitalea lumnitzerae]|uniref:YopX protein domain-containing protein n=1 Tax=Neptunitalea lumnitzerae TaxID=2965509 RepID=A0ABQ5MKD7_9FLAO|nr:hypothetical protein [Neptunitalea sp. Y10]GLB49848.1 hypothetical protein Y10_22160 [Neptunitalea sp. Y10]